jgi:hypothetical protein
LTRRHGAEMPSLEQTATRSSRRGIDRGLWWSDAAFYGVFASIAAFVALMNLYAREAKWWDPKTLNGLRPLAALRHAGYKNLWQVTASFLINFPFMAVAAAVGALVFLLVKRPRSVAYSIVIMSPAAVLIGGVLDNPHGSLLLLWEQITWIAGGVAVFHFTSNVASRVASLEFGQAFQPEARILRVSGMILAIGPAAYLGLEVHQYFWTGFQPRMETLVPLGLFALLLLLRVRYAARPALFASLAATFFLWPLLGPGLLQDTCNRLQGHMSCEWLTILFVVPASLLWVWLLHRVLSRIVGAGTRGV